jgi:hypothetical protein
MAIVNIRGTSGAGKSTVVRNVMQHYRSMLPNFIADRRQPITYILASPEVEIPLLVPGHYETACGGCDTLKTVDQAYQLVRAAAESKFHVLFEGIMVQDDVMRAIALSAVHPLTVIRLTTPIEVCLEGIQSRRDKRGDTRVLNPKNTIARDKSVKRNCDRLREAGVEVLDLDREQAFATILQRFGWSL